MSFMRDILDFLNNFSIIVSSLTFLIVAYRFGRDNHKISIIIHRDNLEQEIPIKILRKQVTRSEILGILGTLDRESNFSIAYTGQKAFFDNIVAVQSGWRANKIHIYIQPGDKFNYAL